MRSLAALILLLLAATRPAVADPSERALHMDAYLAIWSRNEAVTPATVARLYARQVSYYGRPMTRMAVFRDKLAFIRQWPHRRYAAVPGSVRNTCQTDSRSCQVDALMRWQRADASGRHAERGTNSVHLSLVREDGMLRIAAESGAPAGGR